MEASVLVGRILIIEPIGTVPARLYVAKGLVLTIWTRKFYGTRNYSMELFPELASPASFSFLLTISRPPGVCLNQKKSFTLYRTSLQEIARNKSRSTIGEGVSYGAQFTLECSGKCPD